MADTEVKVVINGQDQTQQAFSSVKQSLTGLAGLVSSGAIFNKLIAGAKDAVSAFGESQKATTQLSAVLASTGGVAGVSAEQATDLAKSLGNVTAFSHDTVLSTEDLLLTFTKIGKDIFPQATETTLNMAQALGEDTKSAAIQLGKALQDPILGVTALRRVGVAFNETQVETIKNLVNTGQAAKAQAMVMQELTTEFGNSARMYGLTLPGQLTILSNKFNDVKEDIGQLLGFALGPLISKALNFITANQQMVVSLIVAAGAVAGLVATIAGAAGLIGTLSTVVAIIGGPITIALGLLAALAGVVVFKAVNNLQDKMKSLGSTTASTTSSMASNANSGLGQVSKASQDTADQLKKLSDQTKKTEDDFQQSMVKIVQDHQSKVNDLKSQIADETENFTDAQTQKKTDFDRKQQDMVTAHQRAVDDIKEQIDQETAKGVNADQQRLADLRTRLDRENQDYDTNFARLQEDYANDTKNAKDQHDKKLADLQSRLDQENAFLQKHADDVLAIQGVQLRDEIDALKKNHEDQLAAIEEQRQKVLASTQATTDGIAAAYNSIPGQIDLNAYKLKSDQIGQAMGEALKEAFLDAVKGLFNEFVHSFTDKEGWKGLWNQIIHGDASYDINTGNNDLNVDLKNPKTLGLPGFASGVMNFSGGLAMVGENGPEVVALPKGSSVYPTGTGPGGTTINQYNTINRDVDLVAAARYLAFQLNRR